VARKATSHTTAPAPLVGVERRFCGGVEEPRLTATNGAGGMTAVACCCGRVEREVSKNTLLPPPPRPPRDVLAGILLALCNLEPNQPQPCGNLQTASRNTAASPIARERVTPLLLGKAKAQPSRMNLPSGAA